MTKAERNRQRALNGGRGSGQTYRRLFEYYENEVAQLKEQIEKMKCCENCKHYKPCLTVNDEIGNMCDVYYNGCNNSKYAPFYRWELKEND